MSELEKAWTIFLQYMNERDIIHSCRYKEVTGIPFIYIQKHHSSIAREQVEEALMKAAARAMKGKRLTLSMYHVRENEAHYVYRVRFLVPQRKMFCCGNMCVDCIRFQRD
ncbi:hypothetical protein ACFFGV_10640 [Pontibacillus salicampi]|uniref:Uncharacterized protein n=1 Tax=Pontibacillus salicampi TaxID=1449801 RepID=A0ABV6LNR7_9BACI